MFLKKGELPPCEFFFVRSNHHKISVIEHVKGVFGMYFIAIIFISAFIKFDESWNRVWFIIMITHCTLICYQRLRWKYLFRDWKGEVQQLELPLQLAAKGAAS